jgi:copper chaperone CopZ
MAQPPAQRATHPDLHVVHAIPGRIRLRAPRIRGRPQHAQEVARQLSTVQGVRRADANPATGSITVHYHPSALDSVEFFAEIAAVLGLIATGLGPSEVEALFKVLGVSPADVRASLGAAIGPNLALALALFVVGILIGRRLG